MESAHKEDWVQMLPELLDDPSDKESGSFNVHLYASVRFKFSDIRASSMEQAVRIACERLFSEASLQRINVEGEEGKGSEDFVDMVLQEENPGNAVVDPLNKMGEVIFSKSADLVYDSNLDSYVKA